jgi:hypothetical protein
MADRIDREADASTIEFDRIDVTSGLTAQRHPEPSDSLLPRGWMGPGLERGLSRRNEDEAVETQLLEGRLRDKQVSSMHGIEGAPIEAEKHPGILGQFASDRNQDPEGDLEAME